MNIFKVQIPKKLWINSKNWFIVISIIKLIFIIFIIFMATYFEYFITIKYEKINNNYEISNHNIYGILNNKNYIKVKNSDFTIENFSLDRLVLLKTKRITKQTLLYCEKKICSRDCSSDFKNEDFNNWLWCDGSILEDFSFENLDSINFRITSFGKQSQFESYDILFNTVQNYITEKNKNKIILIDSFYNQKEFKYYKIYNAKFTEQNDFYDIKFINYSNQLKKSYTGYTIIFSSYIINKNFNFLFLIQFIGIIIIIFGLIDLLFENLYLLLNPKLRKFILEKKFIRLTLETKNK